MEDFLKEPTKYLEKLSFSHGAHFFLYNPQLVFFGYPRFDGVRIFFQFLSL